jgi:hypothetical protein
MIETIAKIAGNGTGCSSHAAARLKLRGGRRLSERRWSALCYQPAVDIDEADHEEYLENWNSKASKRSTLD